MFQNNLKTIPKMDCKKKKKREEAFNTLLNNDIKNMVKIVIMQKSIVG